MPDEDNFSFGSENFMTSIVHTLYTIFLCMLKSITCEPPRCSCKLYVNPDHEETFKSHYNFLQNFWVYVMLEIPGIEKKWVGNNILKTVKNEVKISGGSRKGAPGGPPPPPHSPSFLFWVTPAGQTRAPPSAPASASRSQRSILKY